MNMYRICLFVLFNIYLAVQTQAQNGITEIQPEIYTEANDVPETETNTTVFLEGVANVTNLICETCDCADRSVNCTNKNINTPFNMADWNGLISIAPLSVDLSHNFLGTLTRISNLTTLQHLNLSYCDIESIDHATFSFLRDIVSLDLSGNRLTASSINKRVFLGLHRPYLSIGPYNNIRYLNLSNNDIHSLAQDTFAFMTSLTTLDLSGNPLGYIDSITMGTITDLEDLKELFLSSCKLVTLPEGIFRRHRNLRILDLSNNRFTVVPPSLAEAVNLEYFNFGWNPIEVLNGTNPIPKLTKLKELRITRMPKLSKVTDGALSGLANLQVLDLSYNTKLSELEDEFLSWTDEDTEHETWPSIRELYLNNNNLSRVYSGYLERWDLLSRVNLSSNPFLCDCGNQWLVDVFVPLMVSSESNSTLENMICKKPKEMKGISILQLNKAAKIMQCAEAMDLTELPVPDMAILLGIMIGIFVTFPIVLVVILLWRRGTFARCKSRRIESDSEDETDAFEVRDLKFIK